MQIRLVDRGVIYDYKSWRYFFGGICSPGVYRGFDLSVDTTGYITIGATHSDSNPGLLVLPTGLAIAETSSIRINPYIVTSSKTYTIVVSHTDNLLVAGTAATYSIVDATLDEQPTDGTIIGWIRYPGSGAITSSMLIQAPPLRSQEQTIDRDSKAPVIFSPPQPTFSSLPSQLSETSGSQVDATAINVWRGVYNATSVGSYSATGWVQWEVGSDPYQILIDTLIDSGASLYVYLYDTLASLNTSTLISNSSSFQTTTLSTVSGGTWTKGGKGTIKLVYNCELLKYVRISRIKINNWNYEISFI